MNVQNYHYEGRRNLYFSETCKFNDSELFSIVSINKITQTFIVYHTDVWKVYKCAIMVKYTFLHQLEIGNFQHALHTQKVAH